MMNAFIDTYRSRLRSPWVYVALVYALSWGFTIPLALSGANLGTSPASMVAYGLAGLGPAVAAISSSQPRIGRDDVTTGAGSSMQGGSRSNGMASSSSQYRRSLSLPRFWIAYWVDRGFAWKQRPVSASSRSRSYHKQGFMRPLNKNVAITPHLRYY